MANILIVEDNKDLRELFALALKENGFSVCLAADGQQALSELGHSSVDLIVFLYTTVDTHRTFPPRAKELIYNALYENGIEIPFPQADVYVKSLPEDFEKQRKS